VIDGFALIDKDRGWTSHDVVARLRRLYGQKRVGHAGTLDPMATGVLVVGLGHATRLLRFVQGQDKTYEATIRLGQATVTDDAEGEITASPGWEWDPAGLSGAITALTGDILQVPSKVSAIKVNGVRSYKRVRDGDEVELAARPVTVSRFEMLGPPRPAPDAPVVDIDVVVSCSSGTYIRALARDLGESLQSGGHLRALRRTAIGDVDVSECQRLGEQAPPVHRAEDVMVRMLPTVTVDETTETALRNGQRPALDLPEQPTLVLAGDGRWVSVAQQQDGSARILLNAAQAPAGKVET
jgi:tRNA pseudouridine55 synthase